jgi:hypothetical protein
MIENFGEIRDVTPNFSAEPEGEGHLAGARDKHGTHYFASPFWFANNIPGIGRNLPQIPRINISMLYFYHSFIFYVSFYAIMLTKTYRTA